MARIAGVDLPKKKRIEVGLTYVYGVGLSTSQLLLEKTGIDPDTRVSDLTEQEIVKLREAVQAIAVEGDLRRQVGQDVKRLKDIGSYRGLRHAKNLPCRGQRTKTNARTRRGRRTTVGSKKKEEK